jgi:hypothetical protein
MQKVKRFLNFLLLNSFCPENIHGSKNITIKSRTNDENRCTAIYTSGKLVFKVLTGTTGYAPQEVQQSYEITITTISEKPGEMDNECIVYPNPADGTMRLVIKPFEDENMRYRIYDMNGMLLRENKIENRELVIPVENVPSATWLLKVVNDKTEVRLFKIEKKQI